MSRYLVIELIYIAQTDAQVALRGIYTDEQEAKASLLVDSTLSNSDIKNWQIMELKQDFGSFMAEVYGG